MFKNAKVSIFHTEDTNGIVLKQEDDKLLIRCGKGHNLHENEELHFYIHHPLKGEMSCTGVLRKAYSELLIMDNCKIDQIFQNRSEARVDLELFVTIKRMFCGSEMKELTKFIPMYTRNLSASGVGIFSKFNMPLETRLILDLSLDNKLYYLDTCILRKETLENGFYYGCRFSGLPAQIQSKIRFYVYQQQIDQKKREKLSEAKTSK